MHTIGPFRGNHTKPRDTMNKTTLVALALTTALLFQSNASAQRVDNTSLLAAAQEYRTSVLKFEKVVVSTFGIARSDERVVDKFEESTLKVVNAARNPRLSTRLRNEYQKTFPLQDKAEQHIFGRYTPNQNLIRAWEYVLLRQALFEQEYSFRVANPSRGNRVRRLPTARSLQPIPN